MSFVEEKPKRFPQGFCAFQEMLRKNRGLPTPLFLAYAVNLLTY